MQDFLIVYDSKTGNTEKVARALAEAAGERACLNKADNEVAWDAFDVIFVGYWVDKGGPNEKIKHLLQNIHAKKIVFFETLGAAPDSEHAQTCFANAGKYLSSDNTILGTLAIRGAIDPALIAMMRKMPAGSPHAPSKESEARWAAAASHPDNEDLAKTRAYMKRFITMYDKFYKHI